MADPVKVSNQNPYIELGGNILRQVLLTAGASLVTKGFIDAETLNQIIGLVITILTAIWSFRAKKKDVATKQDLAQQVIDAKPTT